MKIYSWNVNGIRAAVRKGALQEFMAKYQPDILCLQETKAQRGQVEIEFEGYKEHWNSAHKLGYSGTAIFTKTEPRRVINDLPAELVKKYNFADNRNRNAANEGRVIAAEFDAFWLVDVYTVNAVDDLSRVELRHKHWDPAFLAYVKELEKKKPVIFCGDLNVAHTEDDLARPKENVGKRGFTNEEREGFQNYIDAGFIDSFRLFHKGNSFYTWWTHWANARARNVGWRIDYFLVSASLRAKIKAAEIHPDVMGSDHCPISLEIDL
ncbi:MAG: exodeoxyribonuclease III [Candidatus Saccharimonadales bacterium]|jgi:exodeoxyribonuclease-3